MSTTENHETAQPLAASLSDQLGPDFVPAGWQERQKLTNGGQWTHWYECPPFPRSAPREFMIGLIPIQRRILQTEDQAMIAINAAVAAARDGCASAAWIHYMDVCKARGLAPSEHEHWNAARAVRES